MKAQRKAAPARRRATRPVVLTLTQRVERLERRYFAEQRKEVTQRFTVTTETVCDNVTGLMWSRNSAVTGRLNWEAAKKACDTLTLGGCSDWRLPTIQELLTLVDYSKTSPSIDPAFQCESSWYWTSTPYAGSPSGCAWFVGFNYGYSDWDGQDDEDYVRAVRAGQSSGQFGLALR